MVVDAGANIGLASMLFSQVINFNGEILAIEANPSTLEVRVLCVQKVLVLSFCVTVSNRQLRVRVVARTEVSPGWPCTLQVGATFG